MRLLFAALLLFISPAFAQYFDAGQVLNQVYGEISTACTQDANADTFSTTVDEDNASGQKVLKVTATTDFVSGDVVVINSGGSREEVCIIDSVSAGDSITCLSNLTYAHTAVQADVVDLTNRLPATGTTGFTANVRYIIYCHAGDGTGRACEITQGTATVNARNKVGLILYSGEKLITTFKGANLFLGVEPAADNTYVDVCRLK